MIIVNPANCPQSHPCPMVRRCPNGALQQQGFQAPTVQQELCLDCGDCSDFCGTFHRAD
ncbi:MAG: 4Fe-4S ferredoxin [Chloroflexota bacterium]|nr:MAG: 4Fe-4S ferredoxin [Chloroflexota bacterium]